jgi:hypothetical protein
VATEFYGLNLGQHEDNVVRGTVTNSTAVEVTIDLAKVTTQLQVRELVEYILNRMERMNPRIPPI